MELPAAQQPPSRRGAALCGFAALAVLALAAAPAPPSALPVLPAATLRPSVATRLPLAPLAPRRFAPPQDPVVIAPFAAARAPAPPPSAVVWSSLSLPLGALFFFVAAVAAGAVRRGAADPVAPEWGMAAAQGFGAVRPQDKKEPKAPKLKKGQLEDGPCPCGAGPLYSECCQPYHLGKAAPPSPEALLRARFTAYRAQRRGFLADTILMEEHLQRMNLKEDEVLANIALSCNNLEFEKMMVLKEEPGETENERWITFRFWYRFVADFKGKYNGVARQAREKGDLETRTERSLFRKVGDEWKFVHSPPEMVSEASFALGDGSAEQNLLLKAKDVVRGAASKAAATVLPKKEVQLE